MGRKKKRRSPPKPSVKTAARATPVALAGAPRATAPARPDEAARDAYWLEKARRAIGAGDDEKARPIVARVLADAPPVDALAWHLRYWPSEALLAVAAAPAAQSTGEALAATVLVWSEAQLAALTALQGVPSDWVAEATAVWAAAAHVTAGDDRQAAEILRKAGRPRTFGDAARLVRGLAAWYRQDAAEARLALTPLLDRPAYRAQAAALLHAQGDSVELDGRAQACRARLGGRSPNGGLTRLLDHLAARDPQAAIRECVRIRQQLPEGLARAVLRGLPAALAAAGMTYIAIEDRLPEAVSELRSTAEANRLIGLMAEQDSCSEDAANVWAILAEGPGWGVHPAHLVRGALSARAGSCWLRVARNEATAPYAWRGQHDGYVRELNVLAAEILEHGISADPDDPASWRLLLEAVAGVRDKPHLARTIERFVKRFPDDPGALRAAAEAALERGAFDKGLRYADRAVEHARLDRALHDLRIDLITAKAAAKGRAGATGQSRALFAEAAAVEDGSAARRLRACALSIVIESALGDDAAAAAQRARALASVPRPWLLAYLEAGAVADLPLGGASALKGPPQPDTDPTAADLSELLAEAGGATMTTAASAQAELVIRGVARSGRALTAVADLDRALTWAPPDRDGEALAAEVMARHPSDVVYALAPSIIAVGASRSKVTARRIADSNVKCQHIMDALDEVNAVAASRRMYAILVRRQALFGGAPRDLAPRGPAPARARKRARRAEPVQLSIFEDLP